MVTPSPTSVTVAAVESGAPVDAVITPSPTSVNVAAEDSVVADSLTNAATPLRSLIMIPKRAQVLRSKREVAHAKIITSSPYKRKLENAAEEKKKKADSKRKRSEKSAEKKAKKAESKAKTAEAKMKQSEKSAQSKLKTADTKRTRTEKSAAGIKKNRPTEVSEVDETPCLCCEIMFCDSSVPWFRCARCAKWVCGNCTGCGKFKKKRFFCGLC